MEKNKGIKYLLLVLGGLFCPMLLAWRLELLNSVEDIAANQKISLCFYLDPLDYALYKNFLNFSIDSSQFKLITWKSSSDEFLEYITTFKESKSVYMDSFRVDLSLTSELNDANERLKELRLAHLSISCVVLGRDKKNRAQSRVLKLSASDNDQKLLDAEPEKKTSQGMVRDMSASFLSDVDKKKPSDETLFWPDQFFPLIKRVKNGFYSCLSMPFFLQWYFLIFFLLLMIFMRRFFMCSYFRGVGWQELERFLLFLFLACHFNFFHFLSLKSYQTLYSFACFCLVLSVYYLRPLDQDKALMINYVRLFMGMFLLALVVYLCLKALLLEFIV